MEEDLSRGVEDKDEEENPTKKTRKEMNKPKEEMEEPPTVKAKEKCGTAAEREEKTRTEKTTEFEKERKERIERAERLSKSWELLRLCKTLIEEEGTKWRKSVERREIDNCTQ